MVARILSVFWVLFILFQSGLCYAQLVPSKNNSKVLLNAQFIERDNEKDITILRDQVQVILENNFISCNEAIILWAKNEIVAVGNVLLKTEKSDIKADKIIYNFKDETGKIFNGIVLSGQVLMQGDMIDKTGPDSYNADNAYFTTCTTCPASWSFTADNVDATIEGYAYIKNPWLHFVEVPFIYIPYLIVPLKNERQTGFLPPSIDGSTYTGFMVELPFFWAINRSQDMTFSARYLEKNGVQTSLNYRYRLSEKSGGELTSYYLRDAAYSIPNKTRSFTTYSHYLELPNDFIQRTSLHYVSDTSYSKNFVHFPFRGESALDNRVSLTKNFQNFQISVDSSFYTSLIQENIDASKSASVHRIPEVRFSLFDQKISDSMNIYFRMNAQYINLSRQGLGYDSPFTIPGLTSIGYHAQTDKGYFDPKTDMIRTGQRIDIQPFFYAPQRWLSNSLNITPYFGYRQTQYVLGALNESQNFNFYPHRNYFQTGVFTSTELSAIYRTKENRYRHSVIPSVDFQSIPWYSQSNHSFFGNQGQIPYFLQTQPLQDADLLASGRGLQFDYEDRIIGRRLVNFGLTNRITRKTTGSLGTQYDQPFLLSLSQAYDFIEAKKDVGRPWQDIRGVMSVRTGSVTSFTEAFYFPYHKVTNLNSGLRFNFFTGDFLELAYSNFLIVPAEPKDVHLIQRTETLAVSAGLTKSYLHFFGRVEIAPSNSQYFWRSWQINSEIIPPGRCWSLSTRVYKILNSDNFGFSAMVNFKFGT